MSNTRRRELADTGRGPVGKTAVVGVKDRATKHVAATVVTATDAATLQGFVREYRARCDGLHRRCDRLRVATVQSRHGQALALRVRQRRHSHQWDRIFLWSMLKRAHKGTFHKLSPKHLDRYVQEFAGRHNLREHDTIDQLTALSGGMDGKRLRYRTLIASNGLASGARS